MGFFDDKLDKVDELTKVYTRETVFEYIEYLIHNNVPFVVGVLDVDNFKYVNDGFGHLVGDRALFEVSKRIKEILGDKGAVGRYGGDEFIIVIPNVSVYDDVWGMWHDMLSCTKNLDSKDLNELSMTVTIGSARFPLDADNIDSLFELADKALYRGKMKGRNCFIIYLKEKHANIDLKTERDKSVTSTYIQSLVYQKLTLPDFKSGLKEAMFYLGNHFMLDHLCIDTFDGLYCNYYHPICKNRNFKSLASNTMHKYVNSYTGIFYKNSVEDNLNMDIIRELATQGVYSTFWVEIKAYDKMFGYLRVDICSNPRGRIWQTVDIDILSFAARIIALELYYKKIEVKELDFD